MMSLFIPPLAVLLDGVLGEPQRLHPLVGFGKWANWLEQQLNQHTIHHGILAWALAVLPLTVLIGWLDTLLGGWWLSLLCGWLAVGWQSLRQHAQWVWQALYEGDLPQARVKVGWLVSRDTSVLDERGVSRACIESVLENGSDAVIAPLFWLAVAGAPGVVCYRLCNTLDAMWGYRNDRFERFGKWAARVDDVLNLVPARLTAVLYGLAGQYANAWQVWRTQAHTWYSPNAGVVMATGAGALGLRLGGAAIYHGQEKPRPALGNGSTPTADDIRRALILLDRSVGIFCAMLLLMGVWSVFKA